MSTEIRERIREKALEQGFDACGFAAAEASANDMAALAAFVAKGWHGDMDWMARLRPELGGGNPRGNPQALMPAARTAIVLGLNYGDGDAPGDDAIAVYARTRRDYHDVMKKKLKRQARWIGEAFAAEVKVFVDTAPVMEKPLAARAGLGWQGKHTNLVSRAFGSWLFLGEILTTLDLPPDLPEADHCGSCRACIDACPTGAIPEPYRLDATRCISYLTIEHKGAIRPELMERMGGHVYGCDDCLAACPWNKYASPAAEPEFAPRPALARPSLAELAGLDDAGFRELFAGSPIKRTGRARFLRNVLVAIGNGGDEAHRPAVARLAADADPLVRETALWALAKLDGADTGDNLSSPSVTYGEGNMRP
ncbi:MAG: tRNA epoxyqueuosine(34) reductase QueG [Rhodospirillaceae bacterium]